MTHNMHCVNKFDVNKHGQQLIPMGSQKSITIYFSSFNSLSKYFDKNFLLNEEKKMVN